MPPSRVKAKDWCEKARKILKIKTKKTKVESIESKRLNDVIRSVTKGLDDLKKARKAGFNDAKAEFLEHAQAFGKVAYKTKNRDLALILIAKLESLGARIQAALTDDDNGLDAAWQAQRESEWQSYEDILGRINGLLADLQSKGEGDHQFVGNIPGLIDAAEIEAQNAEANNARDGTGASYSNAVEILLGAEDECRVQAAAHEKYVEYKRLLAAGERTQRDLESLNQAPDDDFGQVVEGCVELAKIQADDFLYDAAISTLSGINALATLAGNQEKRGELKELLAARGKFAKARVKAEEHLYKIRLLPGDGGTPWQAAQDVFARATQIADTAVVPGEVLDAAESLAVIKDFLEAARTNAGLAKKFAKADLKAMSRWKALLREAENARDLILESGCQEEQAEILQLLNRAQAIVTQGGPRAYGTAIAELEPYQEILDRALAACSLQPDEVNVTEAMDQAEKAAIDLLLEFSECAPLQVFVNYRDWLERHVRYVYSRYQQSIDEGTDQAAAEQDAIQGIGEFRDGLLQARDRLLGLKQQAEDLHDDFDAVLGQLGDIPAPEALLQLEQEVVQTDLADHVWDNAVRKLSNGLDQLNAFQASYQANATAWEEMAATIEAARDLAGEMRDWIPAFSIADPLRDDTAVLLRLLERGEYVECHEAYTAMAIADRYADLQARVADAPRGNELSQLREVMDNANVVVNASADAVTESLWSFEFALTGVEDVQSTGFHKSCHEAYDSWRSFYASPPNDVNVNAVNDRAAETIEVLNAVKQSIDAVLADPAQLQALEGELQEVESVRREEALPDRIRDQINRLPSTERDTFLEELENADDRQALGDLDERVRDAWQQVQADQREYEQGMENWIREFWEDNVGLTVARPLAGLRKAMKKSIVFGEFMPYVKQLEDEYRDIGEMLRTRDPYMLIQAEMQADSLRARVAAANSREEGATRYKHVLRKRTELSDKLMAERWFKATQLAQCLPDTFKRLQGELKEAIKQTMKSSPEDGMSVLIELESKVDAALDQAARLADEHKRFKFRAATLKSEWSDLQKEMKRSAFEDADSWAFSKYFTARMDDVKAMRKTEGGLPRAWSMLEDLERQVRAIRDADNPRVALQQRDADCAQDQQRAIEMARHFKQAKKVFVEETYASTKEIVAQREDGDLASLKQLKKVAGAAGKIVQPYLNLLDKGKKAESEPAPDMAQATADFQRAWQMLGDAERAARGLENRGTTNVDLKGGFDRMQRDWRDYVAQYRDTFRGAETGIRGMGDELLAGDDLADDAKEALERNLPRAAGAVSDLQPRFDPAAFDDAFAVLTGDGPVNEKKAAREAVLRTMREYRSDLVRHPVLTRLQDKDNPFDHGKVMAAVGQLRVALKRIELRTLVGEV